MRGALIGSLASCFGARGLNLNKLLKNALSGLWPNAFSVAETAVKMSALPHHSSDSGWLQSSSLGCTLDSGFKVLCVAHDL